MWKLNLKNNKNQKFFFAFTYGSFADNLFKSSFFFLFSAKSVISSSSTLLLNSSFSSENTLYLDIYYQDYSKIMISFLVATLLCLLLFIVSYFLSFSSKKEYEKSSEYECGFDPFDNATRQPFEVHFYIVGILFLIFDVEVALLFPWAVGLDLVGSTGFWSAVIFLIIITLGFIYEWKRGALSWPHPALALNKRWSKK